MYSLRTHIPNFLMICRVLSLQLRMSRWPLQVDFDEVVSYRSIVSSLQEQASIAPPEFQYVHDCSLCLNLAVMAQGSQFAVEDVEVVTATVDLDEVVSYRGAVSSLQEQASSAPPVPTIEVDFNLCHLAEDAVMPSAPMEPRYHLPEEEIALGNSPAPCQTYTTSPFALAYHIQHQGRAPWLEFPAACSSMQ